MCNIFVPAIVVKPQTGEVRQISHLNFTAWPDHDTPSQPDDLLTFISYMRHVHRSGPIVTHCSAGIGRSGTLICIDVVLGLISRDLDVSTWENGLNHASDLQELCSVGVLFLYLQWAMKETITNSHCRNTLTWDSSMSIHFSSTTGNILTRVILRRVLANFHVLVSTIGPVQQILLWICREAELCLAQ